MQLESKTITISYGAFSFTLEGFDNPLVVLQDISTYFSRLSTEKNTVSHNKIESQLKHPSKSSLSADKHQTQNETNIRKWLETAHNKMSEKEYISNANTLERLKIAVYTIETERMTYKRKDIWHNDSDIAYPLKGFADQNLVSEAKNVESTLILKGTQRIEPKACKT